MGRIKSKLIKRTGLLLLNEENNFSDKFEENKELLRDSTPSKKMRNQIAGYITRKLKKAKTIKQEA
ncbi:30S ribosomal protein S17e [Candidatus Pacearchaeota archaeon]|nr:30S ribosomal protein S17e [Candidatus Pacearchaeota archaeon]